MKKLLLALIILLTSIQSYGQLNVGDIAFIGMNADANEGYSFIALRDIPASEKIFFSDRGIINSSNYILGNEGTYLFTAPLGGISIGTIVSFEETVVNVYTISGAPGATMLKLTGSANFGTADQIYAYQTAGDVISVTPSDATFIAGVQGEYDALSVDPITKWTLSAAVSSTSESIVPPGLTNGVNCVSVTPAGPEKDNLRYTGTLTGTSIAIRAAINDYTNWETTDAGPYDLSSAGYVATSITYVAPASAPTVSTTAAATITSSAATLAGNASADGGDAITERGIVYSVTATNNDPIIGGGSVTKDTNGTGTGVFSEAIGGLSDNTQYSYKAYATNGVGTSYGSVATFTTLTIPATYLNFDGANDNVNLGASLNTVLDPINTFTVEAWVRPETNTGKGIIIGNYGNVIGTMQFLLRRDGGNFTFWVSAGNGFKNVTSVGGVILNTWTHIAGVWDGSTTKIYINGVLSNTTAGVTGANFITNSNPIKIGNNDLGEVFNGDIEDVRLWTRAIPLTEITARKDLELFGNEDGLLAYYKMNQGTNNADNTAITTLTDNSTNTYNGALINFTLTGTDSNWASGSTLSTSGVAPTVSTTAAASITVSAATLSGNASVDGGAGITERGIVWSVTATNADPIIGGGSVTKDTNGSGTGVFSEAISGLSESTQYSYKAYATNGIGTTYGAVMTFTTSTVAPTVTTLTPLDNATDVLIGDNLMIEFSENIAKGTGNILIKKTSDNSTIETIDVTTAAVTIAGTNATINPSSDLELNTEYYVQMASGVFEDLAANDYAGIADTTTWSFTTETNQTNTWSGATDTNWATVSNWSLGRAPIATDNVIITNVANDPVINSGIHATAHDFTINGSGVAVINGGGDLTVNGNVTNNGAFTLNSASSLIVNGTSTGDITYKRNLATTNWYLISSPVVGAKSQALADLDILALGSSLNIGFATYSNNGAAWVYTEELVFPVPGVVVPNTVLTKGYSVKLIASGDITFVGSMPTTDINMTITDGSANEFNLLGNPYPSYIPANTNADAVNNILTINTAQLSEETLWFWDQATDAYVTLNQASASRFIAPAQGFFVDSKASGGTFAFTEAMQSHQATDVFTKTTNNRFEINLAISDGTNTKHTEIYYINGATTAFDNGYDSSIFSGTNNDFALYTNTVTDSQGRKLGIQSLPDADYENMIIPIGVNADAGTAITFSANSINIPAGINVYLEDRTNNIIKQLNDGGSYTITLNAATNGIGQFYLRTASTALGLENVTLDGVSIYKINSTTLRILGLAQGKVSVQLFDVLGKQVVKTTFTSNGVQDVSLPKLPTGIYMVNVQAESGKLNKKIIIQN